ncbi:MAG TPA: PilZ domain-containing protein, partial [Nitrospiraceae bacterium]
MDRGKGNATDLVLTTEPIENRRQMPRVVGPFNLTFSGMDKDHMIVGEGIVIDLSREGIGVRGNRFVKPGMHLALFIELPDSEEHFCIPDARVSWMMGGRFGLHVETLSLDDQSRLCTFLGMHQQLSPFSHQGGRANSRPETANGGTTTMNWWKSEARSTEEKSKSGSDRRKEPRINGRFKVRYSGSDAN